MRIIELYQRSSQVFSIEIFPPKTLKGIEMLKQKLIEFKKYKPDFISVTYGAGGGTRYNTHSIASYIKNELEIETMAHLTCVSHTKAEIHSVLDNLEASNIENIMALRGDPPKEETQFKKPIDGFTYGNELIASIKGRGGFCIGGAGYPEGHPETENFDEHLEHFLIKVKAGVDFVITQLFLDNEIFFKWRDRVHSKGVSIPLIPGVMSALSAEQITRFAKMGGCSVPNSLLENLNKFKDNTEAAKQVGLDYAQKQIEGLLKEGVDGIHLYALNQLSAVQQLAPVITDGN